MSTEPNFPGSPEPPDVPPATSPGGTVADRYRDRARGRAGGDPTGRASRPSSPPAPAPEPDADLKRPYSTAEKNLREAILDIYTGAEMLAKMADPLTAESIGQVKEKCADAWIDLSRRDARVKRLLVKLTQGGAWGGVILAHLPIVLPLLMRKGIFPGGALFGGAPFNNMPPGDGGSQMDAWPYDTNIFDGTLQFGQNGNGGNGT